MNDQHGDAVGVGKLLQPCQRIVIGGIAAVVRCPAAHPLQGVNDNKHRVRVLAPKVAQPFRQAFVQCFGKDGEDQVLAVLLRHLCQTLLQSLIGILQGKIQNRTLPRRKAEEGRSHAHLIGHLQDEKGLADLRRTGEEVCPRRQQSVDDRWADAKACFHQLRHGHGLNFPKPLVRFFNVCYTVCACKRGRLLPIWCNRWNRSSRFFFSCHSHLPCSARSSR